MEFEMPFMFLHNVFIVWIATCKMHGIFLILAYFHFLLICKACVKQKSNIIGFKENGWSSLAHTFLLIYFRIYYDIPRNAGVSSFRVAIFLFLYINYFQWVSVRRHEHLVDRSRSIELHFCLAPKNVHWFSTWKTKRNQFFVHQSRNGINIQSNHCVLTLTWGHVSFIFLWALSISLHALDNGISAKPMSFGESSTVWHQLCLHQHSLYLTNGCKADVLSPRIL